MGDSQGVGAMELTEAEQKLLDQIELDAMALRGCPDRARANGELVHALMMSLLARKAIPDIRTNFFNDPDYNIGGRGRSRYATFEKNGTRGENVFRHPHFLKYLRYFLFGADLPSNVKADFANEVAKCGLVTSGDVVPLGAFARRQVRAAGLDAKRAAEEFYKLALDLHLGRDTAASIRNAVK
jgi:hypothetical protein